MPPLLSYSVHGALLTASLFVSLIPGVHGQSPTLESTPLEFLRTEGSRIFEGSSSTPFRFVSFNIPNLHLIEDNLDPLRTDLTAWRWPDAFEIEDALESVRQMGGTVVRTYVLSVSRADSDMQQHVHVISPGMFNEEAFVAIDHVLAIARQKKIRVIVPFVDQWRWWGGIEQYAAFRNRPLDAFWTDPQIRDDFQRTLDYVLNRVNSIHGIRYRDDPTIFAWETGNELQVPPAWTAEIAAYLKARDSRHLIMDGCSLAGIRAESLADPNIDILTTHHYPGVNKNPVAEIQQALQQIDGKKPYCVGEFGFIDNTTADKVLNTVVDQGVSGALLWSLRFHRREGGFYWHSEPSGMGLYKAYHWPGFASGKPYAEHEMMTRMRDAAFRIRGIASTEARPLIAPRMLPIPRPGEISWQGSAGASSYTVERAENAFGPWSVVGEGISDTDYPYRPLFRDRRVKLGKDYYYRVVANWNAPIQTATSESVGPVRFAYHQLIDELRDLNLLAESSPEAHIVSDEPRRFGEDPHRLPLTRGNSVEYRVDGEVLECRVKLFQVGVGLRTAITSSRDGTTFVPLENQPRITAPPQGDYGYLPSTVFRCATFPAGTTSVRMEILSDDDSQGATKQPAEPSKPRIELSWIEIDYR